MTRSRGIGRSVRLFRAFTKEQTRPEIFYRALAADSIDILREWTPLDGRLVVDTGAGPAEFADAFAAAGARYVPLDRDAAVTSVRRGGVVADVTALPLADRSVDVVFSSNLLEHVRRPQDAIAEMVRVLRPGGIMFCSYTNWLSPWGGHETSPWHWLGAERAADRYARRHGHPPKNRIDETMFRVSVRQGLDWARHQPDTRLLVARPRYLPDGARHLLAVPGVREVLTWNLLLILRRV